ncbi:MAG: hypothetical protein JWM91_4308 [Rhodospirillales bacterium]|nr:hypothetical protein [Rhodospirillales bacterium]
MNLPLAPAPDPTYRLVRSRFPPVGLFDTVATASGLEAILELVGWTNDRLVVERVNLLPISEWVFRQPNSSIVMAAFLHVAPGGQAVQQRQAPEIDGRTLKAKRLPSPFYAHQRDLGENRHGAVARLGTERRAPRRQSPARPLETLTFIAALRQDRIDAPHLLAASPSSSISCEKPNSAPTRRPGGKVGQLLDLVSPNECTNYLKNSGYASV